MESFLLNDLNRYQRQMILPEFGFEGQKRLAEASVLIVGAGGLGSPVAMYLAAAGLGRIVLCDSDRVDITNLHRQILYSENDEGKPKAKVAEDRLRQLNPQVEVESFEMKFEATTASTLVSGHHLLIDATDNFKARDLLNFYSLERRIPLVQASLLRFEGQIASFDGLGGPCYRCLYRELPTAPNCAEAGVLGPLVGIMGSYQALEAIKILAGFHEHRFGELLKFESLKNRWTKIQIEPDLECASCHGQKKERHHTPMTSTKDIQLSAKEVATLVETGQVELLDVREPSERAIAQIGGHFIPLGEITQRYQELDPNKALVVYCHHGVRSLQAVGFLRQMGYEKVRNLKGGIDRWSIEVDSAVARY